jgi:hypothetical protein
VRAVADQQAGLQRIGALAPEPSKVAQFEARG